MEQTPEEEVDSKAAREAAKEADREAAAATAAQAAATATAATATRHKRKFVLSTSSMESKQKDACLGACSTPSTREKARPANNSRE